MASPRVTFVTGTAEVKRREKSGEGGEPAVTWTDGKCTCCPYGYHIDLDFIQYCEDMASGGTLKQLKRIQRTKRKLRKSMEVMLQQQEQGAGGGGALHTVEAGGTPPPDVVHSTEASRLMHMVHYEQSATHRLLDDIDSSVDNTIASIDHLLVTGTAQTRRPPPPPPRHASSDSDDSPRSPLPPTYTARFTAATTSPPSSAFARRPSPTGEESSPLATSLSTSGRTDSLSSLSSVSTISSEAPQLLGLHQAHATAQSAYTATLSAQLAATMETHLPSTEKFSETTTSTSSSSSTVDISKMSVKAIREAMTASLRRLRELEEQVKALPILQVRVSVLKEEKRLLMLQLRAKQGKPSVRHVGVGVDTPLDVSSSTSFSAAAAAAAAGASPRQFDFPDAVSSVRSFSSSSSSLMSGGVKSPPPTLPKPKRKPMATVGVGDHDVSEPYLLQPLLPTGFTTRDHQVSTEIRTHVHERETVFLGRQERTEARLLPAEPEVVRASSSTVTSSLTSPGLHQPPQITINQIQRAAAPRALTRSIGIGDNNVFDSGLQIHEKELRTVILGQSAPTTKRNVGVECRVPTRDVGVTYCCEEHKPDVRSVGVNVDTGSILTSLSFKGEELRTALRDVLHRSVRSVGEQCDFRPACADAGTSCEQQHTTSVGVGDDRVDVTVRAHSATRTVGVGAHPNVTTRSSNTEKGWLLDASTNTPTRNHSHKYTLTEKPRVAFNSTNTESVHCRSDAVQTDVKTFMATHQLKEAGSNTQRGYTRDSAVNTEVRPLSTQNFEFEITFVDQGTNTDVTSSGLNNNAEGVHNKNQRSLARDHRDVGVSEDRVDSFVCSFDEAAVQEEIQALHRSMVASQSLPQSQSLSLSQSQSQSPAARSSSSSSRTVTRTSSRSDSQSSDSTSPRTNRFGFKYGSSGQASSGQASSVQTSSAQASSGQASSTAAVQKSERVQRRESQEPEETTITEEYTVYHTEQAPMELVLNSVTSSRKSGGSASSSSSSSVGQMQMEVPTSPTITRHTEFSTQSSGGSLGASGAGGGFSSSRRTTSSSSSSSGLASSSRSGLSPRDGQGSSTHTTEIISSGGGGGGGGSSRTTTTRTVVTNLQSGQTVGEPVVTEHRSVRSRELKSGLGSGLGGGMLSAGMMDLSSLSQGDSKADKAAKRRSYGEAEERMTSSKTSSSSRSSRGSKSSNRNSFTGMSQLSGSVEDFMPPNMRKFLSVEDLDEGSGAKAEGQATKETGSVEGEGSSSLTTVTTTRTIQNGEMVTVQETRTVKDGKETVTKEIISDGGKVGGDVSVVSGGGSVGFTESRRISNQTSSSQGDVSAADSGFGSMETRHAASFGNVSSGEPTVLKSIMKRSKSDTHVKKGIKFAESVTGGTGSSSEEEEEEGSESDGHSSSSSYEEGSYDGREGSIVYQCQDDQAIAKGVPGAKMFDQNIRDTYELSKEMREACDVMARYLVDSTTIQTKELNARQAVLQAEWFRVSSQKLSSPHQVEDYLSSFNEISRRLLEYIVNMTDAHGNTAFHFAVSHQNFEVAGLLLDTGAVDVNKYNGAGYTALMLTALADASTEQDTEICRRIFAAGDVNAHSKKTGQTALMLAASQGQKNMVQLLLEAKARVNEQDNEGSTALMCACEHGHTAIVKLLLTVPGLNADIQDNDGSTAFTIAMEAGHKDLGVIIYAHLNFSKSSQSGSLKKRKSSSSPTPSI